MTRREVTGKRDLNFSGWIRENLPDSSGGFSVSDLDFVLWNWKDQKVMLLEVKTRNTQPRIGQKVMWRNIDKWIAKGIDDQWIYYGFHYVIFEHTNFEDGKCFLDGNEISENDLVLFLSFNADCK